MKVIENLATLTKEVAKYNREFAGILCRRAINVLRNTGNSDRAMRYLTKWFINYLNNKGGDLR